MSKSAQAERNSRPMLPSTRFMYDPSVPSQIFIMQLRNARHHLLRMLDKCGSHKPYFELAEAKATQLAEANTGNTVGRSHCGILWYNGKWLLAMPSLLQTTQAGMPVPMTTHRCYWTPPQRSTEISEASLSCWSLEEQFKVGLSTVSLMGSSHYDFGDGP
eukprot:1161392-Pelagomonas_calceolata.AAC.11